MLYRAFFSTPESVKADDGRTMNAAYGFLNMLSRLIVDREPDLLGCATDEDWRPQWRVDLIPSYKTHRTAEERDTQAAHAEDELAHQVGPLFELLAKAHIPVAGVEGFEAEDVIGALAARAPGPVEIVSGDRDLFQLVRDPDICVLYPKRGVSELTRVDEAYIAEKYSIPGRSYGEFALLRGDPSDGLPGVPGIGEKSAAALINKHGSIEAVVAAALQSDGAGPLGKVRGSVDYIDRAAKVVLIRPEDVPLGDVDLARPTADAADELLRTAEGYGLVGPVKRLIAALRRAEGRE